MKMVEKQFPSGRIRTRRAREGEARRVRLDVGEDAGVGAQIHELCLKHCLETLGHLRDVRRHQPVCSWIAHVDVMASFAVVAQRLVTATRIRSRGRG